MAATFRQTHWAPNGNLAKKKEFTKFSKHRYSQYIIGPRKQICVIKYTQCV